MRKILTLLGLFAIALTSTAFAHHEGVYVVGEIKDVTGVGGCVLKEDILAIFDKLPDTKALALEFERLHGKKKCSLFDGTAQILGQIQNDILDQNGMPWRIIHIQSIVESTLFEAYLITWGVENIVIKK
ncbi:MAG: hypothetical protein G01um101448_972 [Parcubacteria group bacterium Gr01-1014_48]|nr:MAG: hypothetical protein Greene041614_627 [Parcubacteria group bacterium Greene0416_14]TSC72522.1 MAG: hypothetical protein G01um101448_972 [Parcubacteria group bacterium Gr01-1014_48]TSD00875.1 MAG: hypothetical protein Greene101415_676 [Parcubacteria group bacterium Greene1014_15]TSD07957.1 MAG: hypothetical protein Greene07144_587 [Parcubacteria group bacterium Greene0714_4]